MHSRETVENALTLIAECFRRVDDGDTRHLVSLDILIDHPDTLILVKFTFGDALPRLVGYEAIWAAECGAELPACAIRRVAPAHILHQEPWGTTSTGFPKQRAWYGAASATSPN